MTNVFLTGSRAYGTPRPNSDTDLCILMSHEDIHILASQAPHETENEGSGDGTDASLRFGRVNLICMTDAEKFEAWREATAELVARRPVTRQQAVQLIDEKLEALQLRRNGTTQALESASYLEIAL